MIPALLQLRDAGYQFVMVTNQDGLGTDSLSAGESSTARMRLMLQMFESQGIVFRDVLIDTQLAARERCPRASPASAW